MTISIGITSISRIPSLKRLFVIFTCFLSANLVFAQRDVVNTKDYFLVINAYTEAFSWSNSLIYKATEFVKDDPNIAIYAEHMNLLKMDNDTMLREFSTKLFEKYGSNSPRAILLLGNSTLMLRDDFRRVWGDVPVILCAEKDYIGPQEYYLKKQPIPLSEQAPLTELGQPYNLVLLYSNQYVRENLELMFHILPDMKKFIYVGDLRFINQTNSQEIQEVLQAGHPEVQYTFCRLKTLRRPTS